MQQQGCISKQCYGEKVTQKLIISFHFYEILEEAKLVTESSCLGRMECKVRGEGGRIKVVAAG